MKSVIIFGNGQMADLAYIYLTNDTKYEVVAFCVDRKFLKSNIHRGLPIVAFENVETLYMPSDYFMFIPISSTNLNTLRAEKYKLAKDKGYSFISYVSSKAIVCPETEIGENCFILENNVIQSFAKIGNNVVLWSGNHIGHHSVIMDHCFIASHVVVSGRVMIEPYCFIGVNATIRDNIIIKQGCVIGAGALIMRNTKEKQVYTGQPAQLYPFTSDTITNL